MMSLMSGCAKGKMGDFCDRAYEIIYTEEDQINMSTRLKASLLYHNETYYKYCGF